MSSEKILLSLIEGTMLGIQGNIDAMERSPLEDKAYQDGQIRGHYSDLGAIQACLRLHEAYCKGKMPTEMVENLLWGKDKNSPEISREQAQIVIDNIIQCIKEKK